MLNDHLLKVFSTLIGTMVNEIGHWKPHPLVNEMYIVYQCTAIDIECSISWNTSKIINSKPLLRLHNNALHAEVKMMCLSASIGI